MTDTKGLASKILDVAAKNEWKRMGNNTAPPKITPDALKEWMTLLVDFSLFHILHKFYPPDDASARLRHCTKERELDFHNWQEKAIYRLFRCQLQHTLDVPIQKLGREKIRESSTDRTDIERLMQRFLAGTAMTFLLTCPTDDIQKKFLTDEDPSIENLDEIVEIHKFWDAINKKHKGAFAHPLEPIVGAFLQEITAKNIPEGEDRKHPVAVLKHPLGSIREVQFSEADTAWLREFSTPESITQEQLSLDLAPQSLLPDVLPLDIATPLGVEFKTRPGAVSHTLRIFFEALMALEPKQTQANISFALGDLIKYLYPDGKFHRTNQLPYILNALDVLHFYATVPFQQVSGTLGKWRPVVVRNVLNTSSKNDALIFLDVSLPPDAQQGMLVEKQVLRMLGKKSAPQFSAYLSACALWDKYGTAKGKLIDPTRPITNRNTDGYLMDAKGNELRGTDGKRIKNPYSPNAITQLEREPNPSRTKYPILSNDDLIKACNLGQTNPRTAWKRAQKHWTQMEMDGIVSIERFKEGWRIMPSENHMKSYRAMTEAIKKSQDGD